MENNTGRPLTHQELYNGQYNTNPQQNHSSQQEAQKLKFRHQYPE
jgi:hypothetical protein